ncbi:hypothetical protein BH11PLA2_BH11PLA2_01770 [soil metagenome]
MHSLSTIALSAAAPSLDLIGIQQVAKRLGDVSTKTVQRMAKAGTFPKPIKIGRLARWNPTAVEAWITQQSSGLATSMAAAPSTTVSTTH